MPKILFIVDPITAGTSVQFRLFKRLSAYLSKENSIYIASIFFDGERKKEMESSGIRVISPENRNLLLKKLLGYLDKDNESMLWVESWLREGLLRKNSTEMETLLRGERFDYVINATNTVPIRSDIWWIQGRPLVATLENIKNDNRIVKLALLLAKRVITKIDSNLIKRNIERSSKCIANSKSIYEFYTSRGLKIDGILYNSPGFDDFSVTTGTPSRDYVLAYIGKETDLAPLVTMAERGIKIIGFGSKLPIGADIKSLKRKIDYRGYVSEEELMSLYSNALFTAFPFTDEPFGWVPLESMACGTPVLAYNKQGPSETIVDKVTGWLVDGTDEFVKKAVEIWNRKNTGITQQDCKNGVGPFTIGNIANSLLTYLDGTH